MKVLAAIEARTGRRLHPRDVIFQTLEQLAGMCDHESVRPETVAHAGRASQWQEVAG